MLCPGLINGTDYKNEIDVKFSKHISSIILFDRSLDNPNSNSTWDDLTLSSKIYYLTDKINKNEESKDNIPKNNEAENKINTAEEVKNKDKDKDKDSSIT